MLALLQRVKHARVEVEQQCIGQIQQGLLVFLCAEPDDTPLNAEQFIERLLNYRIFSDESGKMNRSVRDIQGGVLLVPQFTLAADTASGLRPSFSRAAPPLQAKTLFDHAWTTLQTKHRTCARGEFGADMQVHLQNDGPVTFWLKG